MTGERKSEMNRSSCYFDWKRGNYKVRELSKSFDTIDEARRFADGKNVLDIYVSKGKYKVTWLKEVKID